jgi:hypothetical protein
MTDMLKKQGRGSKQVEETRLIFANTCEALATPFNG